MSDLLSEGTLAVMEERRAKVKERGPVPCRGTCGKMIRPWRRSLTQFPGTVMEYSEFRCRGCWYVMMAEKHPADPAYANMPCTSCGAPSRPHRCPGEYMPGTRRRVDKGTICTDCDNKPPSAESTEEHRANLTRFLSRIRGTSNRYRNPYSPN